MSRISSVTGRSQLHPFARTSHPCSPVGRRRRSAGPPCLEGDTCNGRRSDHQTTGRIGHGRHRGDRTGRHRRLTRVGTGPDPRRGPRRRRQGQLHRHAQGERVAEGQVLGDRRDPDPEVRWPGPRGVQARDQRLLRHDVRRPGPQARRGPPCGLRAAGRGRQAGRHPDADPLLGPRPDRPAEPAAGQQLQLHHDGVERARLHHRHGCAHHALHVRRPGDVGHQHRG